MGDLTTFETIIIAIVEGLTEFLPVSSTGHMIITQNILGVESTEFVKAFTVIIQFGAILSVVCLYWKRFFRLNHTPAPAGASALKKASSPPGCTRQRAPVTRKRIRNISFPC